MLKVAHVKSQAVSKSTVNAFRAVSSAQVTVSVLAVKTMKTHSKEELLSKTNPAKLATANHINF